MGRWIDEREREGKEFTKSSNWTHLKEMHDKMHGTVQNIINNNANGDIEKTLSDTLEIDKAISDVFWTVQQVKKENCKNQPKNEMQTLQKTKPVQAVAQPSFSKPKPKLKPKPKASAMASKQITDNSSKDEWASF